MTMYYSRAEMDYVEDQRMKRELQDIAEGRVDLVKDEDGVFRRMRLGETRGVFGK